MEKSQSLNPPDGATGLIDPPAAGTRPVGERAISRRARLAKRDYLKTDHLVPDIGRRSMRGGLATLLSQHARALIDLVAQLGLARMLAPGDFGVVAMVIVVTRFASLLMQMELPTAMVQTEKVTDDQASALFWINVFVGTTLAAILVAVSPLVSMLYDEPRLIAIFAVLASSVIFGSLSVQHEALLRRQMQFKSLATCGVIAVACGAVVALSLALCGAGYWSLVMMHVSCSGTMTAGLWFACKWRPRWTKNFASARPILAFGGRLTGFELFSYASRNVDRVLVGVFWGARWLGLYAQAFELFLTSTRQICIPVSDVTISGMSRLQTDRDQFRTYFLNALSFVLVISLPIAVLFGLLAEELLVTVLGSGWKGAAPVLRVLAVCAMFYPVSQISQWLFKATGRGREMLRWGIFSSLVSVGAFVVGVPYGVEVMAVIFAICTSAMVVPCVYLATRGTQISSWDVWRTFARPFAAGLLSAAAGVSVKYKVAAEWPAWATLLLVGGTIVAAYAFTLLYALGMKRQLVSFWRALRARDVS